jgi:hypothetical protein
MVSGADGETGRIGRKWVVSKNRSAVMNHFRTGTKHRITYLIACVLLVQWGCLPRLLRADPAENISAREIIEHISANEANLSSVAIEGKYVNADIDANGQVVYIRRFPTYRFSRSGTLMKVERQGEHIIRDESSNELVTLELNEVVFYSPESSVTVDLDQMIADKDKPESPFPFPLEFGYGLNYLAEGGQIRSQAGVLNELASAGLLSCRNDDNAPPLVILETTRGRVSFRDWIDPTRGYLLVRSEAREQLPEPWATTFLLERDEVVPMQFGSNWYIASARRETHTVVSRDANSRSVLARRKEEELTVTNFRAGVAFEPGELEFSTNKFPGLRMLIDRLARERIDMETGQHFPLPPPATPVFVRCPPSATASAHANCQGAVPDLSAAVTVSPEGMYTKMQSPTAGTIVGLGTHTVTVTVTATNNVSATCTTTFKVNDTTPPQITCPAPMSVGCDVRLEVPVTFAPTTTDNCDTNATVTCEPVSGSGFKVGARTVTCTAKDASGNTNTCAFTVTRAALGFTGFLSPIGGADATGGNYTAPVRTFKAGSKIPVKFTANCNGSAVTEGVHTLQLIKWSNETTAETPIDASPADAATTGNQFRWATDHWQYVLDTAATAMSVGTWELRATLSDGSTHSAYIALK